jgi:hypothetical protein
MVVRVWSFVLLELAVGAAGYGALIAARHLSAGFSQAHGASTMRSTMVLPVEPAPLEPQKAEIVSDIAGTFLGMKDELLLERMKASEIVKAKLNKGGSSISFHLYFPDGSGAAFKPEQINPQTVPRKEIAAYRINRMLGLNAVPPATARTLHRDDLVGKLPKEAAFLATRIDAETTFDDEGFTRGEVSYWIPTIADSHLDVPETVLLWTKWLTPGEEIPPEKAGLMAQLSSLLVLDMLTNNSDRFSGGNLLTSGDGKILFYMDNTFGFQVEDEGHMRCRQYLFRCEKFSRSLVAALRKMDLPSLRRALEIEPAVLSDAEVRSVIARKDVTLKYLDGLIAAFGADQVLVFP